MNTQTSYFQDVLETVEKLPPEDQMLLDKIIRQRLIEIRRADLVTEVAEARQHYRAGTVQRGTVAALMKELGE